MHNLLEFCSKFNCQDLRQVEAVFVIDACAYQCSLFYAEEDYYGKGKSK